MFKIDIIDNYVENVEINIKSLDLTIKAFKKGNVDFIDCFKDIRSSLDDIYKNMFAILDDILEIKPDK